MAARTITLNFLFMVESFKLLIICVILILIMPLDVNIQEENYLYKVRPYTGTVHITFFINCSEFYKSDSVI